MERGESREGVSMPCTEARCDACGETFELASAYDRMHFLRRDGELCGGEGVPFRKFVVRETTDRRRGDRRNNPER